MLVIALTGVPGTGKTTVAEHLADVLTVVSANELADRVDAVAGYDQERRATIVDEEALRERSRGALPEDDTLVEGALAHHCDPNVVLVLRCHPDHLRDRLAGRGWTEAKVEENVMAETLDAILQEVHVEDAWEIDTTDRTPTEIAQLIEAYLDGRPAEDVFDPLGTADWTETLGGPAP